MALLIGHGPFARAAGNIFDDNWTPPARPTPRPAEVTPEPVAPTVTPKPSDPIPRPPVVSVPEPAIPLPALRPIPSAVEQGKVRTLFKEVFAKQLADRTAAGRRALAQQLIETAAKTADAPIDRFVLLMGARQAAMEASDLSLSSKAVDALAVTYDLDGLRLKLDAALKAGAKADGAAATGDNCRAGLELLDSLITEDEFADAARLVALLQAAAANDPMFNIVVQRRVKEVEAIRTGHEKIAKDLEKLRVNPNDSAANSAVGSFLCFLKGDWDRGMPMLARGSEAAAKELAEGELSRPTDVDTLQRLGDGWWELGKKQSELAMARTREHASLIYQRALDQASGLRKAAMEKRIAEAAIHPRLIDLLSVGDASRDAVSGHWSIEKDGLTAGGGGTRFEFPFAPPQEYLFRVEFSRQSGRDCIYQSLSKGGRQFHWSMGNGQNNWFGFEDVGGRRAYDNPTGVKTINAIENGRRYVGIVEVRNARVRAFLDGRLLGDWKTDYHDMSAAAFDDWHPRDPVRLAVGTWDSPTIFHNVEVLELTGEGKVLR